MSRGGLFVGLFDDVFLPPVLCFSVASLLVHRNLFPFQWACHASFPSSHFFPDKAKQSFVPSEWTSKWLERAPRVPGTCNCLPVWPTFPFRSNYFQMLPDALKKLRGRGRHERWKRKKESPNVGSRMQKCWLISCMTPKHKQGGCTASGSGERKSTIELLLWILSVESKPFCHLTGYLWKTYYSKTKETKIMFKTYYFSGFSVGWACIPQDYLSWFRCYVTLALFTEVSSVL